MTDCTASELLKRVRELEEENAALRRERAELREENNVLTAQLRAYQDPQLRAELREQLQLTP